MEPQEVVALLFAARSGSPEAVTTLGDDAADELRAVCLSLVRTGIAAAGGQTASWACSRRNSRRPPAVGCGRC
jgi:hypothetical protein